MIRLGLLCADGPRSQSLKSAAARVPNVELAYYAKQEEDLPHLLRKLDSEHVEVLLLDTSDLISTTEIARELRKVRPNVATAAFLHHEAARNYSNEFHAVLALHFGDQALEECAHAAIHALRPFAETHLLAFLPAKAGAGCTTVALNAAARLSEAGYQRNLLLECDRHSGILSILVNREDFEGGLETVLSKAAKLSVTEWRENLVEFDKLDMVLANRVSQPLAGDAGKPPYLPSWADYYHLLKFAGPRFETILADLPEIINSATAEVVHCAQRVFIVAEPEMPSLKLAARRREHLEAAEIPRDRIHLIINRWEKGCLEDSAMERVTGCPIFATLPNDFREIKECALEGRIASDESAFGKASMAFAEQLQALRKGAPIERHAPSKLGLLSKLASRMAG